MPRSIQLKEPGAEPCPRCGNTIHFVITSQQVAEDCCEVHAKCKCGYRPKNGEIEDVWGGTGDDNCIMAMSGWNDAIQSGEPELQYD